MKSSYLDLIKKMLASDYADLPRIYTEIKKAPLDVSENSIIRNIQLKRLYDEIAWEYSGCPSRLNRSLLETAILETENLLDDDAAGQSR